MVQDLHFKRLTLANGLEVILHQDRTLPLVVVNIWYYVGSKDEPPGRSGFAHLFEHLMFMGTDRVPESTFDQIMENGGGSNNASTSRDRTNYYSSGPSNLLPTLLWLEADRMESLGRSMTQEKLDLQREVVRNERRQSYENRPYGAMWLKLPEMTWPGGHPYHLPVIGSHEDLMAASVEDVKEFFDTFYRPNNACLVVAGDFDEDETATMIEDLFADIPAGPEPPRRSVPPTRLVRTRARRITDQVPAPRTVFSWHSPPHFTEGDAACDIIAAIFSEGAASRLEQALIHKRRLAQSVSAFQHSGRLASTFNIMATALPGVSIEEVERVIEEEVERFLAEGPTEEEVQRTVTSIEGVFTRSLESLQDRADLLNSYNDIHGHPGAVSRDLHRYRKATVESIREQARAVIDHEKKILLRIEPEEEKKTRPRILDRDRRPELGSPPAWQPPSPAISRIDERKEIWVLERHMVPLVNFQIMVQGGAISDPAPKIGLHGLFAELLTEGAGERDAAALDHALDLLGSELSTLTRREYISLKVSALARNLEPTLEIVADVLARPRFEADDFERIKQVRLAAIEQRRSRPDQIAALVATRLLYGRDHPYGRPFSGFKETIAAIERDDVVALYESFRDRLADARVVAAGDITPEAMARELGPHITLDEVARQVSPIPEPGPLERLPLRCFLVHRSAAPQTVIRFSSHAEPITSPHTPAFWLANAIFGGSFTSRLNMNLREKHGFTYGASSAFLQGPRVGVFTAATSVKAETTGRALEEFQREFSRMAAGDIEEKELEKALATQRTQGVKSFEETASTVAMYAHVAASHLPADTFPRIYARLGDVTTDELNLVARTYMTGRTGVLVLVGDRDVVRRETAALQLPPLEEVDEDGNPL